MRTKLRSVSWRLNAGSPGGRTSNSKQMLDVTMPTMDAESAECRALDAGYAECSMFDAR